MKTKNFLLATAFILCGVLNVNNVKAQEGPSNQDNVTLKIKLQPIQTILVNPGQTTVEFLYASTDNYSAGVTESRGDHLTVFSTGGFEVSVKANSDNFTRIGGTETIPVSDVKVTASNGEKVNGAETFSDIVLSTSAGTVIGAGKGGRDLTYNVSYDNSAGGADKYIDNYIATDGTESVYTAEITYTIAAK
ncbi:MAG: hypothetical protein PHQ67_05115 [Fermentimonas sp.]|nr:hypothetical protein [Fermentimonas sp.]